LKLSRSLIADAAYVLDGVPMSKKWIFLTCVLSLGSIGTSQAHPLDSPDIVYIGGEPCNRACQSYMAWSRQTLAASGHQPPTQLRQRPANAVAHRPTTEGKQIRVARQPVPLPHARAAMLQPSNDAAGKSAGPATTTPAQQAAATPVTPSAEQKSTVDGAVVAGRSESVAPADVGHAAPAPSDSVNNPAASPAVGATTGTPKEQANVPAAIPAPDQKADDNERSVAVKPEDTDKTASTPPPDAAQPETSAGVSADSSTRTTAEQMVAALHDAEQATSGSSGNSDQIVVLLVARPEISAISDLTGKAVAMDDKYSVSSSDIRTAIAAAGALEVQISEGQTTAIDRLIGGEVPAAVLTLLSPETKFPQFAGFNIFRIPLGPHAPAARL
jgi:hypothetical protein